MRGLVSSKWLAILAAVVLLAPTASLGKDKKTDPDGIGNRDVGHGINFGGRTGGCDGA